MSFLICFWIVVNVSVDNRFLHAENLDPEKTILPLICPLKAKGRKLS